MMLSSSHLVGRVRAVVRAGVVAAVAVPLLVAAGGSGRVAAAPPGDWLSTLNAYRVQMGLNPVADDPALSSAAREHSCYVSRNGITHYQDPSKPGYTPSGAAAGVASVVALGYPSNSGRDFIDGWMGAPLHGLGMMRESLVAAGYGACQVGGAQLQGASLDVIRGLGPNVVPSKPIVWPPAGAKVRRAAFEGETPDPRTPCGWGTRPVGTPIMVMMPGDVVESSATLKRVGGDPVEVCVRDRNDAGMADVNEFIGYAYNQLLDAYALYILPGAPLVDGAAYEVAVSTNVGSVSWSFEVDLTAAPGSYMRSPAGLPSTRVLADDSGIGYHPQDPVRVLDRVIRAGETVPVDVSDVAGVKGVSANLTALLADAAGYLTVWDCGGDSKHPKSMPTASVLNYTPGAVVPNHVMSPVSSDGFLCVYSMQTARVLLDVDGVMAPGLGALRLNPIPPERVVDTRESNQRLSAGGVLRVKVGGRGGVPRTAASVSANVTVTETDGAGHVTVWDCSDPKPVASNGNWTGPGVTAATATVAKLSANGEICVFSFSGAHVVVDVDGWFGVTGASWRPVAPLRVLDTRSTDLTLSGSRGGAPIAGGVTSVLRVSGRRGVPAGWSGSTLNVTVVPASAAGYVTVFPCGPKPSTSSVNWGAVDQVRANGVQAPLSGSGDLCVYASHPAHVIIDTFAGWG